MMARYTPRTADIDLADVANEPRKPNGEWAKVRGSLTKHKVSADHVVAMWQQSTPDEVHEGSNWYSAAHDMADMMGKKYGLSTKQAAGIIAVYSPQTGWGTNLMRAAMVMKTKRAIGGKGSGVMATTRQKEAATRILAGEDYDKVLPGMKINNFAHLIENGGDLPGEKGRVVADRHAIGVTRGISMSEKQYIVDRPSSIKRYEQFSDAYRQAAKRISKMEGHPVAPYQVQAVTWLTRQRLNKGANRGKARNTRGANDWADWLEYAGKVGLGDGGGAGTGYSMSVDAEFDRMTDDIDLSVLPAQPVPSKATVVPVQAPPNQSANTQAIANVLLAGAGFSATVQGIQAAVAPLGLSTAAIQAALGLSESGTGHRPNAKLAGTGLRRADGTVKTVRDAEVYYRAGYVLNAASRIEHSLKQGKTIRVALADESLNYRRHEAARAGRQKTAAKVYTAAQVYGPLLGWYLNPLLNNDPECIAANGCNFYADEGTVIGLPGSVHPNCGCVAGPPIDGAPLVNEVLSKVVAFSPARKHHLRAARKGA